MEIILNSGVKFKFTALMDCWINDYYVLEDELKYAKSGDICNSRIQMRITTHALANRFPVCLLIQVWDDDLEGHVYFTEYHPDKKSAEKRKKELVEMYLHSS